MAGIGIIALSVYSLYYLQRIIFKKKVNEQMVKSLKTIWTVIACIILIIALGILWLKFYCRPVIYNSAQEYEENGGWTPYDIPPNAQNVRYLVKKNGPGIHKNVEYSFSLSEYDSEQYIESLIEEYDLKSTDETDLNYGGAHWYNMKVSECNNPDYSYDDFPINAIVDNIYNDSIDDYIIIVYRPAGTGSISQGVIFDEKTHTFICFDILD